MSARYALTPPPPGAVATATNPTPRRRQYTVQPPTLTTTLSVTPNHGLGLGLTTQTPSWTTSLSSPFSQYNPSTFTDSTGGAARGTSPMASGTADGFNVPYNPQQWGTVAGGSPNIGIGQAFHARHRSRLSRAVAVNSEGSGSDGKQQSWEMWPEQILTIIQNRTCRISSTSIFTAQGPTKSWFSSV